MFWEADPTPQQSKKDKGAHVERSDHADLDMWEESLSDRRVTVQMSGRAQVHPSDALSSGN